MMVEGTPSPFHERFDIEVGTDEVQKRFMNRVNDFILFDFVDKYVKDYYDPLDMEGVSQFVAFVLGDPHSSYDLRTYVRNDFARCLHVVEALYQSLRFEVQKNDLSERISIVLNANEVDLGIDWQPPRFVRKGATLLDERLVNEPLRWLSDPKYRTVLEPFQRGLSHYLEDRLSDAVTDMYEALEALAKIVTGRPNKDLSTNAERFIGAVNVSHRYKTLLKNFIIYGNEFRHAEREGKPRPPLSEPEVESFIYLTGLFVRLAMRTT